MHPHAQLVSQIKDHGLVLCELIRSFSPTAFRVIPEHGGWSAALVAEHIYRSDKGIAKMVLKGEGRTVTRAFDAKVPTTEKEFLQDERKFSAWGKLLPDGEFSMPEQGVKAISSVYEELMRDLPQVKLSEEVATFDHPLLGSLTRYEWVHFLVIHGRRHMRQLEALHTNSS